MCIHSYSIAQDEYLLEVVSARMSVWGKPWLNCCPQRISESSIVPDDWVRINGTKSGYRRGIATLHGTLTCFSTSSRLPL